MEQAQPAAVTKVDQAKVGLLIVAVAALISAGLSFGVRAAPEILSGLWAYRLYAAVGFLVAMFTAAGLVVLTTSLRDQALGWLATSFVALEAMLGLAASFADVGRWFSVASIALWAVTAVLLLLTCALAGRDVLAWLVPAAVAFCVVEVASASWTVVRIVEHETLASASPQVKALRLLISLVVHAGFIGVPIVAWVALGRSSPERRAAGW